MTNKYLELKEKHQAEINSFPIAFAFSNKQFEEGLLKLNATKEEVCSIPGGGFIKKTDAKRLAQMFLDHTAAEKEAIKNDTTGKGYILDMFQYELNNHEYNYTMDPTDTFKCLGLTAEEVFDNELLRKGYILAGGRFL